MMGVVWSNSEVVRTTGKREVAGGTRYSLRCLQMSEIASEDHRSKVLQDIERRAAERRRSQSQRRQREVQPKPAEGETPKAFHFPLNFPFILTSL